MSELKRLPCQVCGRRLTLRRDGLVKPHKERRGAEDNCRGVGYRHARWPVGQRLHHHSGSIWLVVEDREKSTEYGDYLIRCVEGSWLEEVKGKETVTHGEYMHRHGWTPIDDDCTCGCSFGRHDHRRLGIPCLDCDEGECAGYETEAIVVAA